MNGSGSAFLVDTNVLVYAYDQRNVGKRDRAKFVLKSLWEAELGALSVQILGEFFNTITRKSQPRIPHQLAERTVINLLRSWSVHDLTGMIVSEAVVGSNRHQMSYWDALIWATAKMNGIPNILTEDFGDVRVVEGVRYYNPFTEVFDLSLIGG